MISVIITTYNRRDIISKSIQSVLNQTYNDFELIIIDDGSTDDTENFIKDNFKDSRIRYIRLKDNKGATFARNKGLSEVRGDYFMVWDSDDILYQNALSIVSDIFNNNSEIVTVSAPARSILNGKEIEYIKIDGGLVLKDIIISRLLPSNHKIRASKTKNCRNVRYKSKNIDFLVNVELAEIGPWFCHPEYLGDVILESTNNSLTKARKKTNLELAKERSPYLAEYLDKYRDLLIKMVPEKYAGFSYGAAIGFFASNKNKEARFYLREAIRIKPYFKYLSLYILIVLPFGYKIFKNIVKLKNLTFI